MHLKISLCLCIATILCADPASAVSFKQQSLLSTGKWVRVNVSSTGVQQISHDVLRALGIDPEKATVYGRPATQYLNNEFTDDMPDDLLPTYCENTSDGRLIFYGEGPAHYDIAYNGELYTFSRKLSTYSNYSTYFITDSRPKDKTDVRPYTASATAFDTHASVSYIEDEVQNDRNVGAFFWDKTFRSASVVQTVGISDFATAGVPTQSETGRETVQTASICNFFVAYVNNIFSLVPTAPSGWEKTGAIVDNSIFAFSTRTIMGEGSYTMAVRPASGTTDQTLADYTFSYRSTPTPSNAVQGRAGTDYRAMIYPRHNIIPSSGQLEMLYAAGTKGENVKIAGAGSSTRVWNVTDLADIYPYAVSDADVSGNVEFTLDTDFAVGSNASRYIAFDISSQLITPEIKGVIDNQNIHGTPVPDLVIITTEAFLPMARQLAKYHHDYLNQDVAVFTQQQVFNEFSSGAPAAMAYRRLAKMMYDRNPSKFRNLLLYGPGHWDNRGILNKFNFELLLTYETENIGDLAYATAYVADNYFGMLADNFKTSNIMFEPQHIGVGRIPASSSSDAQSVNNKILRYITTSLPTLVANSALMVSDAGDDCEHFKQSEQACSLLVANRPELTITKGHRAGFVTVENMSSMTKELIKQSLVEGVALFGYSGHGSKDGFCWDKTLNTATDYDYPPFAMLSTCDPYDFHIIANSLAESMLYKEHGGAIGVIGAMCSVYLPYNQYYNLAVLDSWSRVRAGDTFGEILVRAKQYMLDNYRGVSYASQMFTNALCYNYCGDPALPVPTAAYGVKVETVNGEKAPESVTVYPRVPVEITGAVTNADGSVNTAFNGTVELYLYESPFEGITLPDDDGVKHPYDDDRFLLSQISAKVKDGRFAVTLIAPQPQNTDSPSRLMLGATDTDGNRATGVYNGLCFGLTTSSTPGTAEMPAPTITDLYFNTPGCGSGSVIAPTSRFVVTVDAPAGLNTAMSNIGYTMRVTLDGNQPVDRSLITVESDENNDYTISVLLRDLTAGHHDIAVSASDNLLNRVDAAATFTVGNSAALTLSVADDALPARESLTFNIEGDNLSGTTGRLVIVDAKRETVFSREVTFPYEWNLTDSAGNNVPEGFYEAFAICSASASSQRLPVTVIR